MRRPYSADMRDVRLVATVLVALCCAAPAAAAGPRFGFYDLHDLAKGSRNAYGDLQVTRGRPAAPVVVRCAAGCRFGSGWLGFEHAVGPAFGDVAAAAAAPGRIGWSVKLGLSARGQSRWRTYLRAAKRRDRQAGVPDVLAVVVDGRILAAPFANQLRLVGGRLDVPGFSRAEARAAAKSFSD
jgi:hypothetical protein